MIIPMRCFNCSFMLGDLWRWYEKRVAQLRQERGLGDQPFYIDGSSLPDTPERKAMDELGITRYCCRKVMLTHRPLIEKV